MVLRRGRMPQHAIRSVRHTGIRVALVAVLVAALLAGAIGCDAGAGPRAVAADAPSDPSGVRLAARSIAGRYRITLRPASPPVTRGAIHDWVIRLERTDGGTARPTSVSFDGGMPSHGHGFTTAPRVTRNLGNGEYLVEGVRFHMGGEWELRVSVTDSEGPDGVALAFVPYP